MRGEVVKFREGFVAIYFSYNSNPRALSEMVRFLGRLQGYQRKILVAGEMLELGPEGPELHRNCGREAARAGLELIVAGAGPAQEKMQGGAVGGGGRKRRRPPPNTLHPQNPVSAPSFIKKKSIG